MSFRSIFLLLARSILIGFVFDGLLPADEIARWDFDSAETVWTGNDQVQLSNADGHLQLRAKGGDPFFSAAVQGRAGNHRLSISARFKGNADIQVFWTTEASPVTSEEIGRAHV